MISGPVHVITQYSYRTLRSVIAGFPREVYFLIISRDKLWRRGISSILDIFDLIKIWSVLYEPAMQQRRIYEKKIP